MSSSSKSLSLALLFPFLVHMTAFQKTSTCMHYTDYIFISSLTSYPFLKQIWRPWNHLYRSKTIQDIYEWFQFLKCAIICFASMFAPCVNLSLSSKSLHFIPKSGIFYWTLKISNAAPFGADLFQKLVPTCFNSCGWSLLHEVTPRTLDNWMDILSIIYKIPLYSNLE